MPNAPEPTVNDSHPSGSVTPPSQPADSQDSRPYIIEVYEDWSDYPNWQELEVEGQESEETPRFATVTEARQWLNAYLDAQDERALASWYEQERRVREGQALYERRLAVLEREGLGRVEGIDWQNGDLVMKPPARWKKPKGFDRAKYRVTRDAPPCPHCLSDRKDSGL